MSDRYAKPWKLIPADIGKRSPYIEDADGNFIVAAYVGDFLSEIVEAVNAQAASPTPASGTLEEASRALIEKLDLVESHPAYLAVWHMYLIHGGQYKGPDFGKELEAVRTALQSPQPPKGEK